MGGHSVIVRDVPRKDKPREHSRKTQTARCAVLPSTDGALATDEQCVMNSVSGTRAAYLRRRWDEGVGASGAAPDLPIALYGGGRHTRWLLTEVLALDAARRVAVILDDAATEATPPISGIPVRKPGAVEPNGFGVVVVSSDGFEAALKGRASRWAARADERDRPRVFALYDGLPHGPYDGSHEPMFAVLVEDERDPGVVVEERYGSLTRVRTLPAQTGGTAARTGAVVPVPPPGRRGGYEGDEGWYLSGGRRVAEAVVSCVREHAGASWSPRDLLEWGCSSGRVLRHMPELLPGARCWGCDIDAWCVDWASSHLAVSEGGMLRVFRSAEMPPLPVESRSMDLVYAVSVFTHLAEHWDTWLMELRRVLRPGGYLFASINDERVWARCGREPEHLIARLCPRLDFTAPLRDDFVAQGSGPHAQSFWSTAGVRRRWAFAFDVCGFHPEAIDRVQTGVVLRRPDEHPFSHSDP